MKNYILLTITALTIISCAKEDIYEEEFFTQEIQQIEEKQEVKTVIATATPTIEIATVTPTIEIVASPREDMINSYPSFDLESADYYDYWNLFIEVAELHGKIITQEIVVIEDRQHGNPEFVAWARARNIDQNLSKLNTHQASSLDELVWIGVNNDLFNSKDNLKKVLIMFHEFGHDYFNLEHSTTGIMAASAQNFNEDALKNLVYDFMTNNLQ